MASANSADKPGIEGLLFGRVVSNPDVGLLDTRIDKDLDLQNYVVTNVAIEGHPSLMVAPTNYHCETSFP